MSQPVSQSQHTSVHIGLMFFPKVTQLDLTGPLQVFARLPDATMHMMWKRIEPVPERHGVVTAADDHLRRLPAARHLRARRRQYRRHGQ